jgi:hypothetical protein
MLHLYKTCSKKDQTFAKKTLFYNILSTVPFKVVHSTGNTPFPTFLPLLDFFLERAFCDGAQFSYRIFLNLREFKKRPNFLNSAPTRTEGALFKKFGLFLNTGVYFQLLRELRSVYCPVFNGVGSSVRPAAVRAF